MARHSHHHRHHYHQNDKKVPNAVIIVLIVAMLAALGGVYVYSHAQDQREQARLEALRQMDREGRQAQKEAERQASQDNQGEEIQSGVG